MKLSIVTTLYYSSPYIEEFYKRITIQANKITQDYEIIFVDDGSPDDSIKKAIEIYEKDSKVKIIELSRNFGHHKALMVGLSYAKGEYIFLIDSDLEEEPELLSKFWHEMQKEPDIDVIFGVQDKRKGDFFERLSGGVFWKLINWLSYIEIPSNILTARLGKKRYFDSLILYKESEIFLGGIFAHAGFKQKSIKVEKHSKGKTTYSFTKKIGLFVNSVTSFSNKPLIYIFYLGLLITFFSFLMIINLFYRKLFLGISVVGWSSLIVSIFFFGGLIILILGIIAIYISKIFIEVKQRPFAIIRKIYERKI